MKPFLLFILSIGVYYNQQSSAKHKVHSDVNQVQVYNVYKIDSINSFYIIYAKNKDSIYKIVSRKTPSLNYEKVQLNRSYPFILHSQIADRKIGGVSVMPGPVNCFYYDESTTICLEKSIYDLYSAENIQGLYFVTDYQKKDIN